jgi:succinoglycan biosynthesis transport protein ExoP
MSLVPTREEVPHIARYGVGSSRPFPPSAARSAGFAFTPKDILRILRRRKWLIILSLLIFTIASGVSTWLWLQYAPFYTAQALLVVNPPKTTELRGESLSVNQEQMDRRMLTYARAAVSDNVFADAAKKIRQTTWFANAMRSDPNTNIVHVMMEEISVVPILKTNFLQVSMTGQHREDIAKIVNEVARAIVQDIEGEHNKDRDEAIKRLERAMEEQRKRRDENLQLITSMNQRGAGGEASQALQTLEITHQANIAALTLLEDQFQQAEAMVKFVGGQTDEELGNSSMVQRMEQADPEMYQLRIRITGLEFELENIKKKFGPGHSAYSRAEKALETAREQYQTKRAEFLRNAVAGVKAETQSQHSQIEDKFLQKAAEVDRIDSQLKEAKAEMGRLEQAKEEKDAAEEKITQWEMRITDLQLLRQGDKPVYLHREATIPPEPSMPKYKMMIPAGVFLGLLFGLGLAFLLEFLDTSIKAPSDVSRRVDLPMLGMIPHLDDVEEDIEDMRLAFVTHPNTIICESFRQIRTTLMFSGPAEQRRSILVTSAMPEDGRTSVALNLGHAIANGGGRVLVVDANFRQPMIRKLFPACPEGGLSTTLVGQADWRQLVHEVEPNLWVMASGPIPPNPTELLGSDAMRRQLAMFYEDYDQVLFDGSPCLVVSDPIVLSTIVDGVILIVRAGVNTYGIVQRARDIFEHVGTHIFGVVLNGVRVTAGGYLRKSYETFYEYREAPQLTASAGKNENAS